MSRKKPGGGRVTPKGTTPAPPSGKRAAPARPSFPSDGLPDRFADKGRSSGGPAGPTRSGHHRGNR